MAKYKITPNEGCRCCGTEDVPLASFRGEPISEMKDDHYLCEICACTLFSKAISFPRQCSDPVLYQSIAAGLNIILKEVRKAK